MSARPAARPAAALATLLVAAPLAALAACTGSHAAPPPGPAPATGAPAAVSDAAYGHGLTGNGRLLHPAGRLAAVGNSPTGGALTPDGRFFWSVSTGRGRQDVRVVRVDGPAPVVVQVLAVPGVSGGLAFDPHQPFAYLSGVPASRAADQARPDLPGAAGDVVQVLRYDPASGQAHVERVIAVPPPAGAPAVQSFPPSGATRSWPDRLAVSPDGRRLLVPLNLADAAAVVDTRTGAVRTVPVGHYPYGAAVLRDGRTGLVTDEADGTVSVVDLVGARVLRTIRVGANLSHPEAVVADPGADRAFVAVANDDQVVVLDTAARTVAATVSVERPAGLGSSPVALALAPDRRRLYVAEQGADDLSVVAVPEAGAPPASYRVVGRIPTAASPSAVAVRLRCADGGTACPLLVWQAAKGLGVGPDPHGPAPTDPRDTSGTINSFTYLPSAVTGQVGTLAPPGDDALREQTAAADGQLVPVSRSTPPADTPLRADGPLKHVFFVVRENRTYDQVLGDVPRGDGDPGLELFGAATTPNVHGLVDRFPLLDHVLADSEASIDGHFWTSAAAVSDYVQQNWPQNYGQRGRPYDFGVYSVSWPGNRFLFDQARKQGISAFNYGEALAGTLPLPDKDRDAAGTAASTATLRESDLGGGIPTLAETSPAGSCYPNDAAINRNPLTGHLTWDSSPPPAAPPGAESRVDCFRQRFARQVATGSVPALSYLVLPNDHTAGVTPGQRTPQALVADNDLGLGELVDTISHSPVWGSSLVVVVEDDSQDGADHVDAHRIPALVVSPYARRGAVVHTRYDLLSAIRTMELVIGMRPLGLGDAMATPMYDAFSPTPDLEPWTAVVPRQDRAATSSAASPGAKASSRLDLSGTDTAPQRALDQVLWQSVHGDGAEAPPPGPGAVTGG